MTETTKKPTVKDSCLVDGRFDSLVGLRRELEAFQGELQKALEGKRKQFPRQGPASFYLISLWPIPKVLFPFRLWTDHGVGRKHKGRKGASPDQKAVCQCQRNPAGRPGYHWPTLHNGRRGLAPVQECQHKDQHSWRMAGWDVGGDKGGCCKNLNPRNVWSI